VRIPQRKYTHRQRVWRYHRIINQETDWMVDGFSLGQMGYNDRRRQPTSDKAQGRLWLFKRNQNNHKRKKITRNQNNKERKTGENRPISKKSSRVSCPMEQGQRDRNKEKLFDQQNNACLEQTCYTIPNRREIKRAYSRQGKETPQPAPVRHGPRAQSPARWWN